MKNSIIFERRSVRAYDSSRKASKEQLEDILDAAMHAPSAMNKQPWHFVVATTEESVKKIMQIHPYCESLADAGTAIIVCGNTETQFKTPDGEYWMYDCSAATQNILLRAKELGLDTCWCGIYPEKQRTEAFQKLFGLSTEIIPMALVILGYGAESPTLEEKRYDPKKVLFA